MSRRPTSVLEYKANTRPEAGSSLFACSIVVMYLRIPRLLSTDLKKKTKSRVIVLKK